MALSKIQGNEDTEWKFAKTELILTYFNAHDEGLKSSYFSKIEFWLKNRQKSWKIRNLGPDSLPAPFNLIPSPKIFQKKSPDESNRGSEVDEEYLKTINKLVMRYRKSQKVSKREGFRSFRDIGDKNCSMCHQHPIMVTSSEKTPVTNTKDHRCNTLTY